jgi:hypothetical protein
MPNEGYKSMREIGKQFGATSHEVGQWLENLGLRTSDHQPTQTARLEGWIAKLPSRQPGTWFYDELTVAWTLSPELAHRIVRLLNSD